MSKLLGDLSTEIFTGAHPSLPNDITPLWLDLSNLLIFDAAVQPSPGHFLFSRRFTSDPLVGMIEAELNVPGGAGGARAKYLFMGTHGALFRLDGSTEAVTDVTRTVGGAYGVGQTQHQTLDHMAHRWSMMQWGEWILATKEHDQIQILKNGVGAKFVDLAQTSPPGTMPFTTANIIRRISVYAVALNTSAMIDGFAWSDEDDPEVWIPTATNSAGSLVIRHLNSQIMAAEYLGSGLGIYGRDQLHLAQYVGPPSIIGAEKLLDGIGAWGKDSVCKIGPKHYGWGPRGIFVTDGSQFQYFDAPSIRDDIEKNLNYDQSSKIVAMPLLQYEAVLFFYPRGDSLWNNAAFGVHIPSQTIWPQNYGRQCMVPGAVFDFALTGDDNGNVYMVSEEVSPTTLGGGPLTLVATAEFTVGVGELGIGEMGIGGDSGEMAA